MRCLLQESCMQLILLVLTLFRDFKQYEALVTKHLEIGSGPKTFTLQLNATTEIVFSFPDVGDHGANYTVYVQHKPLGAHAFDRKCLLGQFREICTTSTTMCSCLERAVGKYSLRHVFTKTDEGRWLFMLQGNGSKSEEYVDIAVEDASGSGPKDTIIATAISKVIIAAASPGAIIVVVSVIVIVLSLRRRRARHHEPNASSGGKGVAVRAVSCRRQQQHDTSSAGGASPASFSHPPQQRTPFMDASPINSQYENNPCQQRQWRQSKLGKRRSRFDSRFPHLFSAKKENDGTATTLTTFTHHSQASNVSGRADEESDGLYANTADFI